jgi:hypothetical protein
MTDKEIEKMVLDIWNHLGDYPSFHEKWTDNLIQVVRQHLKESKQPQEADFLGKLEISECGVIHHKPTYCGMPPDKDF